MDPDRELLHVKLEAMDASDWTKMVVHALIDAGHVDALECDYLRCLYPTRAFPRSVRGRPQLSSMRMMVSHIRPVSAGGTNRPENLHLVHEGCRVHKANQRAVSRG